MTHTSARTPPFEWAELFSGPPPVGHMRHSSGMSAVISCASVNERIHSLPSSNCFGVGSFLQEHELRVEEESAFFRQIACRPLDGESVKSSKHTPPLPSSCEGDDCFQMLSCACGARSTHGCQFDVRARSALVECVPLPELRGIRAVA